MIVSGLKIQIVLNIHIKIEIDKKTVSCCDNIDLRLLPKEGLEPSPSCLERILNPSPMSTEGIDSKEVMKNKEMAYAPELAFSVLSDTHLRTLLEAWPNLSNGQKKAIIGIIETMKNSG